uniref:Uncharacterized protein n=1 Tax=Anopheles atroparvus TaxID=41427 RepID=A0A182IRY4_ANOAO
MVKLLNLIHWGLHRIVLVAGVRCQMRQYQKQWLLLVVRFDKPDRFVIEQRTYLVHLQTVVPVVDVRSEVAEVRVEAAKGRGVRTPEKPEVPLADQVRPVAGLAEVLRHQLLVEPEAPRLVGDDDVVLHANVHRVPAGHERRPGRCAERRHVVAVQDDTVVRQSVDVRGRDLIGSVEADIIPALVKSVQMDYTFGNLYG